MQLKFIYPLWGSAHLELNDFLKKVKKAGYAGIEMDLPLEKKSKEEIVEMVADHGLELVAQHWETKNVNFAEHKAKFERHLYNLAEVEPLFINSHTGLDFFSFAQNAELIELAFSIEQSTGVAITHETHRSRFSFAAHICQSFLKEYPSLKLTSDFSHWCCVAETLLENQEQAVDLAIAHSFHVHARVGSTQSAQVIDPREARYAAELIQFKAWWKRMVGNAAAQGRSFISITPEYGPYPYAQYLPHTNNLLADQWEINQFIRSEIELNCET
ncbi:sugar phosphate isomerase/epimerase [uncultured Kriegella sp.]|uniref:sugar phosphate isomerase/epimerase family protein n=1 Tax=uncultured Kriegella sp. TaxID=1798910 RepID=UPI0030DC465D|tara:strand:+ start:106523 stop:107338 length:816 start_codon:yes stop_codon:yes gene_type:complete